MRLIDADRLLTDRAKSTYYHLKNGDIAIPIIDIEHAPTVDTVEVVRCKDCKYHEVDYCHREGLYGNALFVKDDDFCSYGERRTNG